MFNLLKDYSGNGIALKAGEYSREELIALYGDEGRFNFCLNCTSLKEVLIPIVEKKTISDKIASIAEMVAGQSIEHTMAGIEMVNPEEELEIEMVYIAKENIKKGKKIVIKKDEKVSSVELEAIFGDKLDGSIFDLLIEGKISKKDVSI